MSEIGNRTEKEFIADFPIDFGSGHRGSFIYHRSNLAGIIEAHRTTAGDLCAGSIYWKKVDDQHHVWNLISLEPLTLDPSIQCEACGAHGYIRNGQWQDV